MAIKRKESKAFWVLLLWLLILPVFINADLSAQDENLDDFIISEEEPLPDEAPAQDNSETNSADPAETTEADDGDSEPPDPAAAKLPALSADPNELLSKVNGLFRQKKFDNIIKELKAHEDVVEETKELCEIYLQALFNSEKPDWRKVNNFARSLQRLDRRSSLANYAQGLYYQNKAKPDSGKALTFFSKAKSAKKPWPDAATAYYMVLLKKFWVIILAVVLLPVILIANKIKKKKAAAKAAQGEGADADLQNELQAAILAGEGKPGSEAKKEDKKPALKPEAAAQKAEKVPAPRPEAAAQKAEKVPEPRPEAAAQKAEKAPEPKPEAAAPKTEKAPEPEPDAVAQKADSAPEPGPEVPPVEQQAMAQPPEPTQASQAPTATPTPPTAGANQSYASLSAKRAAEIEQAKSLIGANRREPVAADPELERLWSDLCLKAVRGKIKPHARSTYESNSYGNSSGVTANNNLPDPVEPAIDINVSIDLSEESLQDDLVVKLKMLAISDGELRRLLAQKNPAHIPHLIEYVLCKPEPVRLALVARELGKYDDPAVIDTLAGLLYSEDNRVALAAIQGLENSKNPAAILHICPFLKAEIPLLAQAARTALANFGAVKILKAFVRLPRFSDEKIREAGVFVLSRMKGAQVEKLLMQLLNDESAEVRKKTILAMSYQKNPVYIEHLREFFRSASGEDKALARKAIVYLQGFATHKK
jgi:HEAT repeat protein/outer membrane biosynthesis protein TonB